MSNSQFPTSPGRVLVRLARSIEGVLGPLDLSLPQYRLLGYLSEGEAAASKLAAQLAVSAPSVTSIVDGLAARGLVERLPHPDDRRKQRLVLTADAKRLLAEADDAIAARFEVVLDHLDDRRAAAARNAIAHWEVALDRMRAEAERPPADTLRT